MIKGKEKYGGRGVKRWRGLGVGERERGGGGEEGG